MNSIKKQTIEAKNSTLGRRDEYQCAVKNLSRYQFCKIEIFVDSTNIVREEIVVSRLGNVSGFLQDFYKLCEPETMKFRLTGLDIREVFHKLNIETEEYIYQGRLEEWLERFHKGKQYGVECYDTSEGNLICVDCFSDFNDAQFMYWHQIKTGMNVLLLDYDNHICLRSNTPPQNINHETNSAKTDAEIALQNAINRIKTTMSYIGEQKFSVDFDYVVTEESDDSITFCVHLKGSIEPYFYESVEVQLLSKMEDIAAMLELILSPITCMFTKSSMMFKDYEEDGDCVLTEIWGVEVCLRMKK